MLQLWFTDLGESVSAVSMWQPLHASATQVIIDGAGWLSWMFHRVCNHPDCLHCKHLSKNLMMPSIRMLYPIWVIHLQEDHSSVTILSWFKTAMVAGRCRTRWLATTSAWYESSLEYVGRGEVNHAGNLAHFPSGGKKKALCSLVPDTWAARGMGEPILVLQLTDLICRRI